MRNVAEFSSRWINLKIGRLTCEVNRPQAQVNRPRMQSRPPEYNIVVEYKIFISYRLEDGTMSFRVGGSISR